MGRLKGPGGERKRAGLAGSFSSRPPGTRFSSSFLEGASAYPWAGHCLVPSSGPGLSPCAKQGALLEGGGKLPLLQPSALVQDQAPSKRCAKPDGRSVLVKRTSWYLAMDKTAPQP